MCPKAFFFFFFPLHLWQFSKCFALFVSFDCHGDNSTDVTAQTAPMFHQLCESVQKGMKPDPSCLLGQPMPWNPDLGCRTRGSLLCFCTDFLHDLQFKIHRWKTEMLLAPDGAAVRMTTSRATLVLCRSVNGIYHQCINGTDRPRC